MATFFVLLIAVFSLAVACFVKAFGITFFALPRSQEAKCAKESPKHVIGPAILVALCIGLGVFSYQILGILGFAFALPNMLLIGSLLVGFFAVAGLSLRSIALKKRIAEMWDAVFLRKPQRWRIHPRLKTPSRGYWR